MNPVTALRTTELAEAALDSLQARLGDEMIVLPADAELGRGAPGLEPRRRPAARRRRARRDRRRRGRRRRASPREHGLRVAPQGTGHGATRARLARATRSCSRPSRMRGRRRSTPGADARASRPACSGPRSPTPRAEHGLAALAGSSPDVGVVGYTLGGGLSWLGRALRPRRQQRHRDRARHRRRPRSSAPTATTSPSSSGRCAAAAAASASSPRSSSASTRSREVYAGAAVLADRARGRGPARLARVGRDGCRTRSRRSAGCCSSRRCPDIPEPLRGRSFVVVEARLRSATRRTARAARARCARSSPSSTRSRRSRSRRSSHLHMDPEHPVPGAGDGDAARRRSRREAIDALVASPARLGLAAALVELRHLGGALGRAGRRRTARSPASTRSSRSSPSGSR